jgi:hypothetical protein
MNLATGKETCVQGVLAPFAELVSSPVVRKEKTHPCPRAALREISRWEIVYHPFTLKFRGEINHWLVAWMAKEETFQLADVLSGFEEKLVRFYFWPQKGLGWVDQRETAAQMGFSPNAVGAVSFNLKWALVKLKRRETSGPTAIETLKLSDLLYVNILEFNEEQRTRGGKRITTWDQILRLSDQEIIHICGDRILFEELKGALAAKGEVLQEVVFPPPGASKKNW